MANLTMKSALTVAAIFVSAGRTAQAQSLTVLPVSIQMSNGQLATSLTVINGGSSETSIQIRGFVWTQAGGKDQLTASDDILASPPLATIAPGSIQTVRLVVRKPPMGKEVTYRVILDQIPPPVLPGTVQVALRLSIPVFVEPSTRTAAHVRFQVERGGGRAYLVAINSGSAHETFRDIALTMQDGKAVTIGADASPYILADSSSRWPIVSPAPLPAPHGVLHLTAQALERVIDRQVPVVDVQP